MFCPRIALLFNSFFAILDWIPVTLILDISDPYLDISDPYLDISDPYIGY